jgi:aminoglycoside phosphotransferase family enzyme
VAFEPHFAWVFLAGERAYKLKKALRHAQMDKQTLAHRERACRAELRLNRRMAPAVYLQVQPLARGAIGSLDFAGHERIVGWLVELVCLPASRMLEQAIKDGTVGDLHQLMARLVSVCAHTRRRPMSDAAYLGRLRRQMRGNARELRAMDLALDPRRVEEVVAAGQLFLTRHAHLFAGSGARLLDGHGDLRPAHVFLGPPGKDGCVIDCVEFDADLRHLDPAEEVAFLALECARLAARRLAARLLQHHARATGNRIPPALMQLYMARRAAVRARIAAWHLRDAALDGQSQKGRDRAHSYLGDALHHLRRGCALAARSLAPRALPRAHPLVALLTGLSLLLAGDPEARSQPGEAPASQWAQYQADAPKSVLQLQPWRRARSEPLGGGRGRMTLMDLAPATHVWFLLSVEGTEVTRSFHLENPLPAAQYPRLAAGPSGTLRIEGLSGPAPCEVAGSSGQVGVLEEAARSGLAYAPVCEGRLYLRNPVTGHRTSVERITDFLRDHVYGGDRIISFVKEQIYRDAFLEPGVARPAGACLPAAPDTQELPAAAGDAAATRCLLPGSLGLDVSGTSAGFSPGRWYPVSDLSGVYASVLTPGDLPDRLLAPAPHVNRPDAVETGALVYVVAFDLKDLELHFALGSDHPRLDWSPRPQERVRNPQLPGPDGVASAAPLVMNGLVSPADVGRVVATFAGGFKREHGAFRYGPFAQVNHGSHYGFVQEGVILSRLQPGLATLLARDDGGIDMKTWGAEDEASLPSLRYARQNGVPLIERGVPGALVNRWGPGNWSGSPDADERTLRAGACLQETATHRFLLYGWFSAATPSAMARVFQAYGCRYAMQLDMNALEHTYLALYVHRDHTQLVEHLVAGMEQVDSHARGALAPRFLAAPDDRDFFDLMRREAP